MGNPTKELRRMLDELGVKWETGEDSHGNEETWWRSPVFDGDVCATLGEELGSVQLDIPASITPEQAIAATMGKDIERYDGSGRRGTVAILQGGRKPEEVLFVREDGVTHYLPEDATVGAGTLTAEQVRECVKGVYFEGYSDGATHRGHGIEETDWQNIADKLNATLGAGTCKRVYHPNRITKTCTCSNCGYGASDERWAYCPKCGHKYVHGEVEERWKRVGRKVAE